MKSERLVIAAALAVAAACSGGDDEAPAPVAPVAIEDAAPPAPVVEAFDAGPDEAAALRELGARPAWEAVIDRAELLARRGDGGAVVGTLVEGEGGLLLVDDEAGDGALAIRVRAPAGMQVDAPFRALVWGAWIAADGRWLWQATRVARLGPATAPAVPPGLVARPGTAPEGAVAVSRVERRGGAIVFAVVGAPDDIGDGWLVADAPGQTPVARLFLPGEREPYGGQNYLAEGERWQLEIGRQYALEVGRVRRARDGSTILRARTPPKLL